MTKTIESAKYIIYIKHFITIYKKKCLAKYLVYVNEMPFGPFDTAIKLFTGFTTKINRIKSMKE